MIRISTQTLFETGAARIGEVQAGLAKTQQQISTGRRMVSPSDDPVAAARVLEVSQTQSLNTQFGVNRMHANYALTASEGTLAGVTALIQDVKDTIISAGNPSIGDSERGFMATDLRARLDALMGLANTRDAAGDYIFAGFRTDAPAFSKDPLTNAVTYNGDAGQKLMQVDATRQMAVNHSGSSVFQGGGQDLFQTLNDLITLFETPGAPSAAVLGTHNANIDLALDNVLTVRAALGSRLQEIDALNNVGEDRGLQYSQILSELQDLDYTQALTQLSQQQFVLEAAHRSFVSTSALSLFKFM
ncbi:MAG: flagellar hook-associated protein FlgL [Thiobacillus sp.]